MHAVATKMHSEPNSTYLGLCCLNRLHPPYLLENPTVHFMFCVFPSGSTYSLVEGRAVETASTQAWFLTDPNMNLRKPLNPDDNQTPNCVKPLDLLPRAPQILNSKLCNRWTKRCVCRSNGRVFRERQPGDRLPASTLIPLF